MQSFASTGKADWPQIVDFMRDNPKLLMQMIPSKDDNKDDLPQITPSEAAIKKTRINDRLQEAQKWKINKNTPNDP